MSKANSISSPFFILSEGSTLAMSLCSSELKKRRMFGIVSSISCTRALKLQIFSEAGRFSLKQGDLLISKFLYYFLQSDATHWYFTLFLFLRR